MYAKIESERLGYIRSDQKELRSEEYAHLQYAINNDAAGIELDCASCHSFLWKAHDTCMK